MNRFQFLSLICFTLAILLLFIGFLKGEITTGIFFIFPFIAGTGIYSFLSIILLFFSILLFTLSFVDKFTSFEVEEIKDTEEPKSEKSIKGGGLVLIGPIPIVFGSNWKIALALMIIAIFIIIIISILHFY